MVRVLNFHTMAQGLIPGQGTEIPQAIWHGQKEKKRKEINITKIILSEQQNESYHEDQLLFMQSFVQF